MCVRSDSCGRTGSVKLTILGSGVTRMGHLGRLFVDSTLFPMPCSASSIRVFKDLEPLEERPAGSPGREERALLAPPVGTSEAVAYSTRSR